SGRPRRGFLEGQVGGLQRQRLLRCSRKFRIRAEAATGEFPEYFIAGTELGDVQANGFDVTGDVAADDLEPGCAKPGDETKWRGRPAQQMPIACVRGCGVNSHQHVAGTRLPADDRRAGTAFLPRGDIREAEGDDKGRREQRRNRKDESPRDDASTY